MKKLVSALALVYNCSLVLASEPPTYKEPWYFYCPPIDRRLVKAAQSFMFTRPFYSNLAQKWSINWRDAVYEKDGCLGGSVQIIPAYQHSIPHNPMAKYFLIDQKSTIVIKGDSAPNHLMRDVRAEWFQLPADYVGTMSFSPEQRQFGFVLEYNQDLTHFVPCSLLESLWFEASIPFQVIENKLHLEEQVFSTPPTTFPHNMQEAFNRSTMFFGKVRKRKQLASIAEISLKLGTTFLARDGFHVGAYSGFLMPTSHTQQADYMFNPFIGYNRHFGFLTGANFQLPLNADLSYLLIAFFFDIENRYYLRNYQYRSLDVMNKPWSRYMILNAADGTKNIPAINILTRKVKVQPFNFVDFTTGFRIRRYSFEFEIGYNLWAHGDEQLILHKPFPPEWGFAGTGDIPGTTIGRTASLSTISTLAANDDAFVPITERDFNFQSGAGRAVVAHRAHMALGYVNTECEASFTLFFGAGAFVEIPQNNTSLQNWGAWCKMGSSF